MQMSKRSPRSPATVVAALAAAGSLLWGAAPPAVAESTEQNITWAVSPADATGPDGRSWIELDADPGDTISEYLSIRNLSDIPVEFDIQTADGYFTETGRFNMLPAAEESVAAGTWIDARDSVVVEAGATMVVPFTITVPENAIPGDHAAGIAASVLSVGSADGAQVSVDSRVGFRVMTRVAGAIEPELAIDGFEASYHTSWNPFEPGFITVEYTLADVGNTRLSASADVTGPGVTETNDDERTTELLPGDRRTLSARIDGAWPIGLAAVNLDSAASVLPDATSSQATVPSRQVAYVWAMPWPQLILAAGVILLALAALRSRRKRDALIAQLRELSREAAHGGSLDDTPPMTPALPKEEA